jgi:NAD(P)-dependent dehydrogenase (short-subunit alcohol dehydrogenase family)
MVKANQRGMTMSTITKDLAGKTYLVTGANSGIGFEAAKNFATRGATTIIVCRSAARGEEAKERLVQLTGNPQVHLYIADFSLLASVSEVADAILADFPVINVLCNNAGGANADHTLSAEGFELTFVTNHLSGFLLTQKLLPAIIKGGEQNLARIVFTSSYGHTQSPLDFDDLGMKKNYKGIQAYGRSKLMNLLTAREVQRRYSEHNIVASSFHPGAVRTPIWKKGGTVVRTFALLFYPFMISIEKGTDTFIWLASSNDEASVQANGRYFVKRTPTTPASFATDEAAQTLWQVSMDLVTPYL